MAGGSGTWAPAVGCVASNGGSATRLELGPAVSSTKPGHGPWKRASSRTWDAWGGPASGAAISEDAGADDDGGDRAV